MSKTVEDWLDGVKYEGMFDNQQPSKFALKFLNFIKLVNGGIGESHKTPPMHLTMLDKMNSPHERLLNLCFRGSAKTTLFAEYMVLYLGLFGELPVLGEVSGAIFVANSMEGGVKDLRKNVEFRYENSEFLQYWLPRKHQTFTDSWIELINKDGKKFGMKMFGAQSGIRGTKIYAKRPKLAILDDLVKDDEADSKVSMQAIKHTIYKGVDYALDPVKRKIIFNGTPFNKQDPIIEAVESGTWDVNVWPVCERFPCSREEFRGAWEDRFSYDFVNKMYEAAVKDGKTAGFYQELMLRITAEDERIVKDADIQWISRDKILRNRGFYNFYITTDFATSEKDAADFSVIAVWAYNSNGDWTLVDLVVWKQDIGKTIDMLFTKVQEYKPLSVGIEITGQQGAYIRWLRNLMQERNIWFTFATSTKDGAPGIRPMASKLVRFNQVAPLFGAKKMFFAEELKLEESMGTFLSQLKMITYGGLKGKDDCVDATSQLFYMNPWKPSVAEPEKDPEPSNGDRWSPWTKAPVKDGEGGSYGSYIV